MPERQRDGSPTKVDWRACRLHARRDLALARIQPPPAPLRLLPEDAPSEIRVREPQICPSGAGSAWHIRCCCLHRHAPTRTWLAVLAGCLPPLRLLRLEIG